MFLEFPQNHAIFSTKIFFKNFQDLIKIFLNFLYVCLNN